MKKQTSEALAMSEFVRVRRNTDSIEIAALVVTWNSQTPASDWRVVRCLSVEASESEVAEAIGAAVADRRYFSTCDECGERLPHGMTSPYQRFRRKTTLCHGCAQKYGVVF